MERYTIATIDVQGYDAPVPNAYWTIDSDTLLVLLPGLGYTNQMPVMFYMHEIAIARNWDVLQVDYDYRPIMGTTTPEELRARMISDVEPLIRRALEHGSYRSIILAGKSIGTRVMSLLHEQGIEGVIANIWLTPLLRNGSVREAIAATPSVIVFGSDDPAVQEVDFEALQAAGASMIVMPGADHGMMIAGDVPASISGLADVFRHIETWLNSVVISQPSHGE